LARPHQYDVLHAHFGPVANNFRFARTVCQAPLVVTFHGYDFSQYPQEHGDQVYRRLFQEADAVMGISQYAVGRLVKLGCPEEKLSVHYTGVYPDRFPFRARRLEAGEPVRILTVGRLVEKKGLEYALRAVAEVRHSHSNLRYEIIGEGPLRSELQDLVRRLELGSIVTLRGAAGSVADGHSGLLVEERNVEQLVRALLQMVQKPQAWPAMGECGRKLVEARFDTARLNRDLLKIYEKALSRFAADKRK